MRTASDKVAERRLDVPFISVVIPVRNEQAHLGALLEDLLDQDYSLDRYEILVADGCSTDSTAAVVERYRRRALVRIALVSNPARLSSAGRNAGVYASQGDLIVFIDGHCRIPSRTLLRDTARLMAVTGADCLCRPQPLTAPGNTWFQDVVAHTRASLLGHGRDSTIYATGYAGPVNPTSSGASYRRSVFERVGMYDEQFDACEDVEFNHRVLRAGLCSYFSSRLEIYYRPRSSLPALFQQVVRYGRGRFRFLLKHPDARSVSQFVPAAWVVGLVGGGFASFASAFVAKVALIALGVYGTLVLGSSIRLAFRHGWQHLFVAPAVYFTIHFGLGTGFLAAASRACSYALWHRKCRLSDNSKAPRGGPRCPDEPAASVIKATGLER
jgi:glycosyltransferase involved in cell wall biosynthesis